MSPIHVASMCQTHRVLLVRQCEYGRDDPWRALEIATQIALFHGVTADPRTHAETGGQIEKVAGFGCLACRKPDLFGTLIDTVQKTPRREHFGAIKALGEKWVADASVDPRNETGAGDE